jgi:hypothetical protein
LPVRVVVVAVVVVVVVVGAGVAVAVAFVPLVVVPVVVVPVVVVEDVDAVEPDVAVVVEVEPGCVTAATAPKPALAANPAMAAPTVSRRRRRTERSREVGLSVSCVAMPAWSTPRPFGWVTA